MKIEHAIVRLAGRLVPAPLRAEWLAEWNAELHYALEASNRNISFALGAFPDAVWLRRNHPRSKRRPWLQSPVECAVVLGTLATFAAISVPEQIFRPDTAAVQKPRGKRKSNWNERMPILAHLGLLGFAALLLPIATKLPLGNNPCGVASLRGWAFLSFKLTCLIVIVFGLLTAIGGGPLRPHGLLLGYILAFRWALVDQRSRCPVCLRRLTNPTRFGSSSQTLLEWYGTELFCPSGHGLLHVPELPESSFGVQSWISLDASWQSLFTEGAGRLR